MRSYCERDGKTWCCSLFCEFVCTDSAVGAGIIVLADRGGKNHFALQFHAVAESSREVLTARIGVFEKPVVFAWTGFIKFCPWCGKDLEQFYGRHAFDNAADIESITQPSVGRKPGREWYRR